MIIRPATLQDHTAIWSVLEPTIRAGETYALAQDLGEADAIAYWTGSDRQTFVAEIDGVVIGTYYLKPNQGGRGSHVCNCGYVTASTATGKGVARAMCAHSLDTARSCGFRAMQFNFVLATNTRAVGLWQSMGFEIVGRVPAAYDHPTAGFIDALIMFRQL